ncbi:cupin domain-containing protein [Octadecabacter sp. G9-8]|uniref:Cupin domain-containing protein n=1 Tax=Octadecabacter dasysiphoniae TaxID=2909341 RepID=A0ABS9CZ65_9RHOB|nr:cupin domain-containing protein [Octadecabacter dasysiphoniae]MCF2872570.1 cupin domain-containing protein [Octadecabacter dasysiphoniae]
MAWRDTGGQDASVPAGSAQMNGREGDLFFAITAAVMSGDEALGCQEVSGVQRPWALRVDEVAFPVGAVAHRHTHTGSGWRHLVSGSLRIEAEHGAEIMHPGMSWFEPANSPVRAVALQTVGMTRFVRCMVIPTAYKGRSTFQLCDPEDAALPRLQVTHRHVDHVL